VWGRSDKLQIEKSNQAKKYLKSLDAPAREKLERAIEGLKEGKGDIIEFKSAREVTFTNIFD